MVNPCPFHEINTVLCRKYSPHHLVTYIDVLHYFAEEKIIRQLQVLPLPIRRKVETLEPRLYILSIPYPKLPDRVVCRPAFDAPQQPSLLHSPQTQPQVS